MAIQLRRLSHGLGAEVSGIDLTKLGERDVEDVRQALLDSGILLFRGRRLTTQQHIALSRVFGELDTHDNAPQDRHPEFHEVLLITNKPKASGAPSDTKNT